MDAQEFHSLQEAYMEVVENQQLVEAEGSYGQTPNARQAMGQLAIARRSKPASEYSQKGEKTKKVKAIEKHTQRIDNGPDAGHSGRRSTKPRWSGGRGKMDQDARDYARDRDVEYSAGHNKPGTGTVTKNPKKLRKQRAMGEIGENYDIYDIILSHLLDEGYAETPESAEAIMVNMSEEWRESIVEGDALRNTVKKLEAKRDAMNREKPGSANTAPYGKQSVGAATYKAYQRLRGV